MCEVCGGRGVERWLWWAAGLVWPAVRLRVRLRCEFCGQTWWEPAARHEEDSR